MNRKDRHLDFYRLNANDAAQKEAYNAHLLLLSMGCVLFCTHFICLFPIFLPPHRLYSRCTFFPSILHEAPCCILNIVLKALAVHPFLLQITSRFTTFNFIEFFLILFNRINSIKDVLIA